MGSIKLVPCLHPFPYLFLFGIYAKYGSSITPLDISGKSIGLTGGSYIGFENSASVNISFKEPIFKVGVNQFGISISPSVWSGVFGGYTIPLLKFDKEVKLEN